MKKSVARKLAVRGAVLLIVAFMLLLFGAYRSLSRQVALEGEHYAKVMVGIYGDVIVYESQNLKIPIDQLLTEGSGFFGKYMCTYYRVDYMYAFVPDVENGTITYLSFAGDREKYGDLADDHIAGDTEKYELTGDEIKAWNGETLFSIKENDRFGKGKEVMMMIADEFGNKVMVGGSVSEDSFHGQLLRGFEFMALFMFLIVALFSVVLYLIIRRMATDPARRISKAMSDYISGGKRSEIRLKTDGDDEFSMMAESFNHMTDEIDRYVDDIARLGREQERRQAEFDIASEIQRGILHGGNAAVCGCSIEAVMRPARIIGGDLYDYLRLDKDRLMVVVADVSGKGLPSAMMMTMALTLIRQFARIGYSPAEILGNVNDNIAEENPQMMFVTAFVGIYDSGAHTLTCANAGHNPPYLIHDAPSALRCPGGVPLGLFPGERYTDSVVNMEEGDALFLYTDGVNEAVNESGEFYGTERLESVLGEVAGTGDKRFVTAVEESVRAFAGGTEQSDDITMLALNTGVNSDLELDYDVREFSAIRGRLLASGLPHQLLMELCVVAEECFVNICSYAFDGPAPEGEKILFSVEFADNVVMRFSDGGRRFNPCCDLPDAGEYDIDVAVGGLGRLIAFTVADSVEYEYKDGRNVLTITKSIKN